MNRNTRGLNNGARSRRNGATPGRGSGAGSGGALSTGLAILHYLAGMRTAERNDRRVEAMGNAQLAEHFNHFTPPEDDDVIHYQDNSPTTTTHNHYQAPKSKTGAAVLVGAALALAGSGGVAGFVIDRYLSRHVAPPAATDTDTQNTLRFIE